jgi:hypothetical protein
MDAIQARPGDVVLGKDGRFWRREDGPVIWSTFEGPVVFFGPWDPAYGPQGDLLLVFRDGHIVPQALAGEQPEIHLPFRLLYPA